MTLVQALWLLNFFLAGLLVGGVLAGHLNSPPTEWVVYHEWHGYLTRSRNTGSYYNEDPAKAFVFRDRQVSEMAALREGARVIDKREIA